MSYRVARDFYEEGDVHVGSFDAGRMGEAILALNAEGRLGERWPADARLKHTPPEAIPLGQLRKDALATSLGVLIVNQRYRTVLETHAADAFEMLPVQLQIRPDSLLQSGWWVAHVPRVCQAVDRQASVWKPSPEEGKIRLFRKLVLQPGIETESPAAFRLAEMDSVILFRADLVAALSKAGLTGLRFIEPERFDSMRF